MMYKTMMYKTMMCKIMMHGWGPNPVPKYHRPSLYQVSWRMSTWVQHNGTDRILNLVMPPGDALCDASCVLLVMPPP